MIKLPQDCQTPDVQFVILHHTGIQPEHYDLMLALPGEERLVTWRILTAPATWAKQPVQAERIADHRKAYLTYEGEVSGGRGNVKRISEGTGTLNVGSDNCRFVMIDGKGEIFLPVTPNDRSKIK